MVMHIKKLYIYIYKYIYIERKIYIYIVVNTIQGQMFIEGKRFICLTAQIVFTLKIGAETLDEVLLQSSA